MKKVLYITNKEVPYKVSFFNELSKKIKLIVIYESKSSGNRNSSWAKSVSNNFEYYYLDNKNQFFQALKIIKKMNPDRIVIGCTTSKIQTLLTLYFKIFKIKYDLNVDGEYFFGNKKIKDKIKAFFIKGAENYFIAGKKSADSLKMVTKTDNVYPYYFSSLTEYDLKERKNEIIPINKRKKFILVVGQYFAYKGLDIAVQVAKKMPLQKFIFVRNGI